MTADDAYGGGNVDNDVKTIGKCREIAFPNKQKPLIYILLYFT